MPNPDHLEEIRQELRCEEKDTLRALGFTGTYKKRKATKTMDRFSADGHSHNGKRLCYGN